MTNHHQVVQDPTRGANTLDILFTTHTSLVGSVIMTTLLSLIHHWTPQSTQRNPGIFNHSIKQIRNDLQDYEESFFTDTPSSNTVDQNWDLFKIQMLNSINKWVPINKLNKSNNDIPWMTREAKYMKRRKERLTLKQSELNVIIIKLVFVTSGKRTYMDYSNNLVDPEKDWHKNRSTSNHRNNTTSQIICRCIESSVLISLYPGINEPPHIQAYLGLPSPGMA